MWNSSQGMLVIVLGSVLKAEKKAFVNRELKSPWYDVHLLLQSLRWASGYQFSTVSFDREVGHLHASRRFTRSLRELYCEAPRACRKITAKTSVHKVVRVLIAQYTHSCESGNLLGARFSLVYEQQYQSLRSPQLSLLSLWSQLLSKLTPRSYYFGLRLALSTYCDH
jgi:hypothetical protein